MVSDLAPGKNRAMEPLGEVWAQAGGALGAPGPLGTADPTFPGRATKRRGDFSIQRRRATAKFSASRFSFGPASYFNSFIMYKPVPYLRYIVNNITH